MKRRAGGDAGETLIEILMTVVILGLTVLAVLAALWTAIAASSYHRRQADADVATKDYAEALRLAVSQRTGSSWCSTSVSTYSPSYTAPSDWSGTVTVALNSCPSTTIANTAQFQTATVTSKSSDGLDTETQKVVLAPNWCWSSSC